MSYSSTSRGGEPMDLRFSTQICGCGRKAIIKVVDSEKPSKGRLYYVCGTKNCEFWAWCYPISVAGISTGMATTPNNGQIAEISNRVMMLEANQEAMKFDQEAMKSDQVAMKSMLRRMFIVPAICLAVLVLVLSKN